MIGIGVLPTARQFGLRGEGPHLPEERGVPQPLDPDRLLGHAVETEDELDEEDRVPDGLPGSLPNDLPGLAPQRLDGGRPGLLGHALEWGDRDRLVDEPVHVGRERAELLGFREPEQGGGLGRKGALEWPACARRSRLPLGE